MTDAELIANYIEKNYVVSIADSGFIFEEIRTHEKYYVNEFIIHLIKIFGVFIEADGTLNEIFEKWFEIKKTMMAPDLLTFLPKCRLRLGQVSWEVYFNNNLVTIEGLLNLFGSKYTRSFIEYNFENWKDKEIYKRSEQIMRIKY